MNQLVIDLSKQEYPVFDISNNEKLEFGPVNFIFGKNGSGKSTLSKLIEDQYGNNPDYSVHIYTGMEKLLVENKLNTIVLGEENQEAKKKIETIESELDTKNYLLKTLETKLKSLEWKREYLDLGIEKHELFKKNEEVKLLFNQQKQKMEEFYTYAAKKIREFDSKIKLTLQNYDKNSFKREINMGHEISIDVVEDYKKKLLETPKEKIDSMRIIEHNYRKFYEEVRLILSQQPKQLTIIEEIGEDSDKKTFAHRGREIHEVGDKCAFCGNIYTESRKIELENYFSLDEMREINFKINDLKDQIEKLVRDLDNLEELKYSTFYSFLENEVENSNQKLKTSKQIILDYLEKLLRALDDKQKDMFVSLSLDIENIPDSFENILVQMNKLIDEHNTFSDNFKIEQEDARDKLRLHFVNKILLNNKIYPFKNEWEGYSIEITKLNSLEERVKESNNLLQEEIKLTMGIETKDSVESIKTLKMQIEKLNESKKALLDSTKNTHYLAEVINKKLKATGKENIKLKACNVENDVECYMIVDENENTREISKISTGEKNIIAFLYFIGNIKSIEDKSKKIIIFDDPMTSNDDTLQYLMITELQRFYRGTNKIFNREEDIFICMTHNIHFHLNVQPQGNFEDKNGKTKYDKNYFYVISNGKFNRIMSEKDDFKTSYESLWIELNDLYENNYLNSMLNSMRRIVETFIKFNRIHQDKFYKDKEEHLKIFNVNSHEAIEEISAEAIGKNKEQLIKMFRDLFNSNGYDTHFNTYWKH